MGGYNTNNITHKKIYFEMMRIIACVLVIFNHTKGFDLYTIATGAKRYFYVTLMMITKINVPLFFMISGALLLVKKETWIEVFKKRLKRVFLLLLLFQIFMVIVNIVKATNTGQGNDYSILSFLRGFINNSIYGSLPYWYLYSYLGILFVLPLLQRISDGITNVEIYALLGLHFVYASLLPMINVIMLKNELPIISLCSAFSVPFAFEKAFFYTIVGYYIEYHVDINEVKIKHLIYLVVSSIVGILLSNWATYQEAAVNGFFSQSYNQSFDYLYAITVFILIKYFFVRLKPRISENMMMIICFVGSLTLGIYMMDPILRLLFYSKYEAIFEPYLPTLVVSVIWVTISMFVGGTVTCFLRNIPIIKEII